MKLELRPLREHRSPSMTSSDSALEPGAKHYFNLGRPIVLLTSTGIIVGVGFLLGPSLYEQFVYLSQTTHDVVLRGQADARRSRARLERQEAAVREPGRPGASREHPPPSEGHARV